MLGEVEAVVLVRLAHAQADTGPEYAEQRQRQPPRQCGDREAAGDPTSPTPAVLETRPPSRPASAKPMSALP